jgi:hypothetical protein
VIVALILIAGETWVVLTTNKYWPLSLDDYLACLGLIIGAQLIKQARQLPWLMCVWLFMFGNIYAMLFNRLDPVSGTGERITLLIGLLGVIGIGGAISTYTWLSRDLSTTSYPKHSQSSWGRLFPRTR